MRIAALFLIILTFPIPCKAGGGHLIFIDNSVTNDTYIPSNKKKQVVEAFHLAISDLKKDHKRCDLKTTEMIGRSDPLYVLNQAPDIKRIQGNKFLIGLIHSSEAILGAKAFKDSGILAISSGAASDSLNLSNPDFFSLANPVSRITTHVINFIKFKKITKAVSIIPGNSSYSIELAKDLKKNLLKSGIVLDIKTIDLLNNKTIKETTARSNDYQFIYVPGFIQQTLPIFESLSKSLYKGIIYGSANLARSKPDLNLFTKSLDLSRTNIFFPATWMNGENLFSTQIEAKFKKLLSEEVMGTAIYTYDATYIAGTYVCTHSKMNRESFIEFIKQKVFTRKLSTAREYLQFENGHLLSNISTVRYNSLTQSFIKEYEE